jgi:hypothetical protein
VEGYTTPPPIPVTYAEDELAVFARYGVGDLVGVEGALDGKVGEDFCPLLVEAPVRVIPKGVRPQERLGRRVEGSL